jgi:hypothetical protein
VGPLVEHLAIELRAVVDGDRLWQAADVRKALKYRLYPQAGKRCVDLDGQTFAGAVVDDGEAAQAPVALEPQQTAPAVISSEADRSFRASSSARSSKGRAHRMPLSSAQPAHAHMTRIGHPAPRGAR